MAATLTLRKDTLRELDAESLRGAKGATITITTTSSLPCVRITTSSVPCAEAAAAIIASAMVSCFPWCGGGGGGGGGKKKKKGK